MAQFKGKYLADAALNWFKGTTYPAAPAQVYVALFTATPTARDGTGGTEVTGGSYARVSVPSSAWAAVSSSGSGLTMIEQLLNSGNINFATATANWGTIVGAALMDASTGGNCLEYGDLTASQTVNSGNTFQIPTSDLIVQEK